jgi:hypothetical protein
MKTYACFCAHLERKLLHIDRKRNIFRTLFAEKERQCTYNVRFEAHSCHHCGSWKAISIVYDECVFAALVIQHAKRMRHIFVCGLSSSIIFFHIISWKARFSKESYWIKMCVFIFSINLSGKVFVLRRTEIDTIINVYRSFCKIPVTLVRFLWNFNFLSKFSINTQVSNFMKLRPVGAKLFHEDGQTDRQTWRNL